MLCTHAVHTQCVCAGLATVRWMQCSPDPATPLTASVAATVTLLVMLVVVLAAALVVVLVPLVTEPTAFVAAFLTESRMPPCASAAAADAGHTTF
jgi:hypothetical protein